MSFVCPKDFKGCCDDMCHGAGCLRMGGYQMLLVCDVCRGFVDEEIPDLSTCTCEGGDDYYEDDCEP